MFGGGNGAPSESLLGGGGGGGRRGIRSDLFTWPESAICAQPVHAIPARCQCVKARLHFLMASLGGVMRHSADLESSTYLNASVVICRHITFASMVYMVTLDYAGCYHVKMCYRVV